ncbi:acyltransferase [Sphingomonas sp. So64.6b]|uniref:acyltransferase family protein n=1 Tax=Sphingomonas sp. So64.6b TaxID=2997354 RepID=UPI001601EB9D|nr:acyltransferase [Sphingomonas sp. So64.6b]QNA83031.1 acyltransferase [Sphingomonas sp. So64.6b]
MAGPKPRTIIALDLLRFASALMVVAFHFGSAFALAPSPTSAEMLAGLPLSTAGVGATWFGWVGVELFFVISGFVIAMSAQGASTGEFLRRRALRLLPAAWICATVTLAVLWFAAPSPFLLRQWLRAVSFWPVGNSIDPSYWTLGIELAFYLVIAAGLGQAGTLQRIERRAVWIGALSAGFWLFARLADWGAPQMMDYRPFQLLMLPHGCFFALGVLAWAMLHDRVTRHRMVLFTLLTATAFAEITGRAIERAQALGIEVGPTLPIAVFAAGLILVLASLRLQPTLETMIDARLATTLGLMTYPLYLIHQEAGAALVTALMHAGLPMALAFAATLALAIGFSWWVARRAEPIVKSALSRALDTTTAAIAVAAPRRPTPL